MQIRSIAFCAGLLAVIAGIAGIAPLWAAAPPENTAAVTAPAAQRFVHEGLALELSVQRLDGKAAPLMEGEPARVTLSVSDTATGAPLSKLYPGAWMDRLASTAAPGDGKGCQTKVEAFLGGSILSRPELDLNTYYVLSLNEDSTISVVDPLFGYGNSKLLTMAFLKSPGEDWALTEQGNRLFVSLPDSNRVAVVESADWKVVTEIETPARPRRVGLQPDGHYLWVAYDGAGPETESGVAVIDARALRKVADIKTGKGGHDLAFSEDSRFVFVTNEGDGTVSVIDAAELKELRDVPVGQRPVSIAWSSQARAAWVSSLDGTLAAVDPTSPQARHRIEAEPGLGALRFAPGGRLAFVVNPGKNLVHIVDAASGRLVQTADVEKEPDQVAFSDELAYVRHRGSETVLMIPLKTVGEAGRPVPVVDFPGGQHPPGRLPRATPAAGIVQAPGASAVLVANPEDKAIYYYKEGMAAPMGHFRNYGKQPRAVLVVDRSLREVRPGVYETITQMARPGKYDLAMFISSPRLTHCFAVEVAENPALRQARKPPLTIEMLPGQRNVTAGQEVAVRFRVTDSDSGSPKKDLGDVRVLTFLAPGVWQQRHWAEEVGEGVYEVRFLPPDPGVYYVFVEVASAKLPFQKAPYLVLEAAAPAAPDNSSGR